MSTFTNKGTFNIKDTGGDAIHLGKGAVFHNEGEMNLEQIGGHGVYINEEAITALRSDTGQIEDFLAMPSLAFLRDELIPLLSGIKAELNKPQPSGSFITKSVSTMKDFLAKAAGGAAGTMALSGLNKLVEHAHTVAAHLPSF